MATPEHQLIHFCAKDGVGGWHAIHPTNIVDHEIDGWFMSFSIMIDKVEYWEDTEAFRKALFWAKFRAT